MEKIEVKSIILFVIKYQTKEIKMADIFANIINNNNHHCSFCCNENHDIRFCDSPEIRRIEQTIATVYYSLIQESIILGLNEEETEQRFVTYIVGRVLLRFIRVLAVTSGLATASGYNKAQYAAAIYRHYKQAYNNIIINNNDIIRNLIQEFNQAANTNSDSDSNKYNITAVLQETCNKETCNKETCNKETCNKETCYICLDDEVKLENIVKLNCNHQFCCSCIVSVLETNNVDKVPICALCRADITTIEVNSGDNYNVISGFCNM